MSTIYKTIDAVAITAGTPVTVWTPASGKRIRVQGYQLSNSASSALEFQDSAAPGTVIFSTGIHGVSAPIPSPPLGEGIQLADADNTLDLDVTANASISGTIWGVEE